MGVHVNVSLRHRIDSIIYWHILYLSIICFWLHCIFRNWVMKWMSKLFPVPCLCLYLDKTSAFPTAGQQSISWALKGKKICTIDWESDIHTVERLWFCSSQGSFNGPTKYHSMIKPLIISRQAHHVFMATIVFTSSLWRRTNTDRYCCCGCHKWKRFSLGGATCE